MVEEAVAAPALVVDRPARAVGRAMVEPRPPLAAMPAAAPAPTKAVAEEPEGLGVPAAAAVAARPEVSREAEPVIAAARAAAVAGTAGPPKRRSARRGREPKTT